jgi:hypothetical protein
VFFSLDSSLWLHASMTYTNLLADFAIFIATIHQYWPLFSLQKVFQKVLQ